MVPINGYGLFMLLSLSLGLSYNGIKLREGPYIKARFENFLQEGPIACLREHILLIIIYNLIRII